MDQPKELRNNQNVKYHLEMMLKDLRTLNFEGTRASLHIDICEQYLLIKLIENELK